MPKLSLRILTNRHRERLSDMQKIQSRIFKLKEINEELKKNITNLSAANTDLRSKNAELANYIRSLPKAPR